MVDVRVRFIHTADLQLGMTRRYLDEDAQARYAQARIDTLVAIGRLATRESAEFVVAAGDVFETNRVRPRTVGRALEAMATIPVPVYLLPGNHDPLDAASVYRSPTFVRGLPPNVFVLESTVPREVRPHVQVIGAPWTTKRPLKDLVGDVTESIPADPTAVRIVVGHGAVDNFIDFANPAAISLTTVEAGVADGRVQYVALGDRHSTTEVGSTGRFWYSGSPEPTSHDEVEAGNVLVVDVSRDACHVTREPSGTWRYVNGGFEIDDAAGIWALDAWLAELPSKDRSVVRLALSGVISLTTFTELQSLVVRASEVFGSIEEWEPSSQLIVRPDDDDFTDLGLSGFAFRAVDRLRALAVGDQADNDVARDALALLVRLSNGRSVEVA